MAATTCNVRGLYYKIDLIMARGDYITGLQETDVAEANVKELVRVTAFSFHSGCQICRLKSRRMKAAVKNSTSSTTVRNRVSIRSSICGDQERRPSGARPDSKDQSPRNHSESKEMKNRKRPKEIIGSLWKSQRSHRQS